MKSILVCCLFLLSVTSAAQQTKIYGVITLFNSKTETGKLVFVPGARIDDDFQQASTQQTDQKGRFTLIYVGTREGVTVSFTVKKDLLQVINTTSLKAVAGQKDSIKIFMASPDKIAGYRQKIYNVGKTEAQKQLELRITQLNNELKKLQATNKENTDYIAQLTRQIEMLEKQSKTVDDDAKEFARSYAIINLDEASPVFREAFLLFQRGNTDSALAVLAKLDLAGRVAQILQQRSNLEELLKQLNLTSGQTAEAILLKADLEKNRFAYDSAAASYHLLVLLDSANTDYLARYARFMEWLNHNDEALAYYNKAITLTRNSLPVDDVFMASMLNNMGKLYTVSKNFNAAKKALLEALHIRIRLADSLPTYRLALAKTINNMGNLYHALLQYDSAVICYKQALNIMHSLQAADSVAYFTEAANIQNNLGIIYYSTHDTANAEKAFLQTLLFNERLRAVDSLNYFRRVADVQNNLGNLYQQQKKYKNAIESYLVSVQVRRRLAAYNPQTFEPLLAQTQNNLGSLFTIAKYNSNAEACYMEALEIRTRFAALYPAIYEPQVAQTAYNLGYMYSVTNNAGQAGVLYQASLEIYEKLAAENPQLYQPYVLKLKKAMEDLTQPL
ncbi:tetratricopeptide repeat protein [Foetidibacter luteolus]|uniref:tetratricopeptide repeat protein n=1 Tax=Foetidibacter luteolus TaxID=2608880 RepID=UPI00129A138F|nr:tetratricopeptide repeat protein [Foetidibacter luteolus]